MFISQNGLLGETFSRQNHFIGTRRAELISVETFNSKCDGVKVACNALECPFVAASKSVVCACNGHTCVRACPSCSRM